MPKTQLCSFCYASKLAVMRQNPYGIYDGSNFKDRYDYTIKSKSLLRAQNQVIDVAK
jgi:hypothetical protein